MSKVEIKDLRITRDNGAMGTPTGHKMFALEVEDTNGITHGMAFIIPEDDNLSVAEVAEGFRDFGMTLQDTVDNPKTSASHPIHIHDVLVTNGR